MNEQIEKLTQNSKPGELTELNLDDCGGNPKLQLLQPFTNVEFLSIKHADIASLKGFPKLPNLKKLDLGSNKITSTLFFLNGCPQLTHLSLSGNKIKDVYALKSLGKLKNLQSLILVNCPVTSVSEYRKKVFHTVKCLKDLDGEDKTAEDAEPPQPEPKKDTDDPMNGSSTKKRKSKGPTPVPKKLKSSIPQKNALMQLNELKPGLKYVIESVSGPPHSPQFVVTVEVGEAKYVGHGTSKQLAKHAAAEAALASFLQFPDMSHASGVMPSPVKFFDFSTDVGNDEPNFSKFEKQKNGSDPSMKMDISVGNSNIKNSMKILSEADKKNPVMLLNEIRSGLTYQLTEENLNAPSQRFCMKVDVDGVVYEGTGPNKKMAKASAARSVLSNLYNVCYNTIGATLIPSDSEDAELFNFPQAVADKIAKSLITTFNEVMVGNAEHAKWKIIAGIAMTKDEGMQDMQIVSIGTGTKCISGEHISMVGANLNDCHAEIISRRALKDFFYTHLEYHLEGEGNQSIFLKKECGGFCLKPNIKFHLYISTAPCGDARIFCPHEEGIMDTIDRHPNRNSRGVLRTKIESGEGTIPIRSGQGIQTWDGILPGQERLLTMSCSDKIASWNVLGIQGALLSYFMEPIYLESVILGGLFHPDHLRRALFSRFEKSLKDLPPLFRLNKPKMCAITSPETRHLIKSPNFSVNWTHGLGRAEVINVTNGKTENGKVSRLSKRAFFHRFMNIYDRLPLIDKFDIPKPALYCTYKGSVKNYHQAKKTVTAAFADAGLGTWVKKPVEQNEFEFVF